MNNKFKFFQIWILPILFFLTLTTIGFSQLEDIRYDDVIYNENIHSVKFHLTGLPLSQPIIDLGSNSTFTLSFDDFDTETKDIYYTIIHCNADWQPSDLTVLEYLDGFDEDQIDDLDFSFNTLTEYTNYQLTLPNDNISWTKSGNYILVVYENEVEKTSLFSCRFMVVEPLVKILHKMVKPAGIQKAKTHQEIDFKVSFERLDVKDPKKELRATILQNGRWDNAISNLEPFFIYPNEVAYDYQDKIVFPAGKEFRYVDLRSFRYRNERIAAIEEYKDLYEITLYQDPVRTYGVYQFIKDINGNYTIENIHQQDNDLQSDYGLVLFSLEKNMPYPDADVYLFGKMTNWKIQEQFKLAYSEKLQLYAVDVLLKQGYYNYVYAVVPRGSTRVDFEEVEGNWFGTENQYTIFIYFRSFGGRYDQLVGGYSFSSN